jgi:DNA-binding NarL/FixJ family response regulator
VSPATVLDNGLTVDDIGALSGHYDAQAVEGLMTTLLLIDDHPLYRDGLKASLAKTQLRIVGEASTGREGLELARLAKPEIAVVDLGLPDLDGVAVTRELVQHGLTRVLVLSTYTDVTHVRQAMSAGAKGYVSKQAGVADVLKAIRAVASGESYLPVDLREKLQGSDGDSKVPDGTLAVLSPRERQIFHLVVAGQRNDEIAKSLHISPKTVETHRARINEKLDAHSPADLVRFAAKHGWLN